MIYVFILVLWPIVNFYNENILKIQSFNQLCKIFSVMFVGVAAAVYLLGKVTKRPAISFVPILMICLVFFFNYDFLTNFFSRVASIFYVKSSLIWLLALLLIVSIIWNIAKKEVVSQISKLLSFVFICVPAAEIIYSKLTHADLSIKEDSFLNKDFEIFNFRKKPNIYFIMTDAYGRQDTVLKTTGYDYAPFVKDLKNKGFLFGNQAVSNYHFTTASLSATFNMKLHKKNPSNANLISAQPMYDALKGDNNLYKVLRLNGYKIIEVPAHWHGIGGSGYADICISSGEYDVIKAFLSSTPLRFFSSYLTNDYVGLDQIKKAHSFIDDQPVFVFAHLGQIHDAIYNEQGAFKDIQHPMYSDRQNGARYAFSIKETNRQLDEIINFLEKKDPTAIIIIQADHGPSYVANQPKKMQTDANDIRIYCQEDFDVMFGIFSAIYVPNLSSEDKMSQYFSDQPTPVNLFRCIFSYLSEIPLVLERDDSFLLYQGKEKDSYHCIEIQKPRRN